MVYAFPFFLLADVCVCRPGSAGIDSLLLAAADSQSWNGVTASHRNTNIGDHRALSSCGRSRSPNASSLSAGRLPSPPGCCFYRRVVEGVLGHWCEGHAPIRVPVPFSSGACVHRHLPDFPMSPLVSRSSSSSSYSFDCNYATTSGRIFGRSVSSLSLRALHKTTINYTLHSTVFLSQVPS
jgi:hypothetical protein